MLERMSVSACHVSCSSERKRLLLAASTLSRYFHLLLILIERVVTDLVQ